MLKLKIQRFIDLVIEQPSLSILKIFISTFDNQKKKIMNILCFLRIQQINNITNAIENEFYLNSINITIIYKVLTKSLKKKRHTEEETGKKERNKKLRL